MGIRKKHRRKTHLYTIFIKYLILFCVIGVFVVGTTFTVFSILVNMKVIYQANYIEQQLEVKRSEIQEAEKITENLIPQECSYGVYHEDGTYIGGVFDARERKKAWDAYTLLKGQAGSGYGYKYYPREGEICIVRYPVRAVYSTERFNDIFPAPEIILLCCAAAVFLVLNILLVRHYARYLRKQLFVLTDVAQKVKEQDLEFVRGESGVCEIEEVLDSMDEMRVALKDALEQQWLLEERRKEQAAAVAHDIKTPLTVIRGNSELLNEADTAEEAQEYSRYIRQSVAEIETYLKELQKMLRSEADKEIEIVPVETKALVHRIETAAKGLAAQKNIEFQIIEEMGEQRVLGVEEELYRAVMNVVSNAVDYSPEGSYVCMEMRPEDTVCRITVTDSGRGFTEEELRHALERFYQGDKSRSAAGHYGMGLSIAAALVERQDGSIQIGNSEKTGGGQVTLIIPVETKIA